MKITDNNVTIELTHYELVELYSALEGILDNKRTFKNVEVIESFKMYIEKIVLGDSRK